MKRHFITFLSPGTFVAESTTKPIDSWSVEKAVKMAKSIKERYNATPYGFYFTTRSRKKDELDSSVEKTSPTYYLPHCRVETIEDVRERNDPKERILLSNMECNHYDRIVRTTKGWLWTQPLNEEDVVLEA